MLLVKWRGLMRKDFARYVMILTSGTMLAQLIPVLISPLLTRIFSPEEFALLAFYMAVASFFVAIATFRYEQAILLPKNDQDAVAVVWLCCLILVFVVIFSGLLFFFFGRSIAAALGHEDAWLWLLLIPASVFSTGLYRIMINWVNRKKRYTHIAVTKVVQTGTTAGVSLSTGSAAISGGLIIGEILGHFVASLLLMYKARYEFKSLVAVTWGRVRCQAQKYADFAKINTPHVLIDTVQSSGVVFILVSFFGDVVLGMYALMMRVLMAPVGMLGSSVAQVFYKQASDIYNQGGDVYPLMRKVTFKLAVFSWPVFAVFMLFSPSFFALVFGETWRQAGEYAQLLIPWIAVHFVVMPVMQLPMIFDKQRTAFIFGLVGNSLILGSIFYGGYIDDVEFGFILLSSFMVVYFMVLYLWLSLMCSNKLL